MIDGLNPYSGYPGLEISRGQVRRLSHENIWGFNVKISSGTAEDVFQGDGLWPKLSVAEIHAVDSTSPLDTSTGTGARTVRVEGLDASGLWQSEDVVLQGTTPVNTVFTYLAVLRLTVLTVGSLGSQGGNIQAEPLSLPGKAVCRIRNQSEWSAVHSGAGVSNQAVWQIPSNKRGYVTNFSMSRQINSTGTLAGSVTCRLSSLDPSTGIWHSRAGLTDPDLTSRTFTPPLILDPLTVLKVSAMTTGTNVNVSAGFDLILERI